MIVETWDFDTLYIHISLEFVNNIKLFLVLNLSLKLLIINIVLLREDSKLQFWRRGLSCIWPARRQF